MYDRHKPIVIRLERDGADQLLPKDFFDVFMNRFLPVLSLVYVSMILAIAAQKRHIIHYLFEDTTAYVMSLFVVLWVAAPGILWIFLKGNPLLCHVADLWYKIIAFLMTFTIALSYIWFPEAEVYGLRLYFVVTVPLFVIMYVFFVKSGLPPFASYPLNALGGAALIYGAFINMTL